MKFKIILLLLSFQNGLLGICIEDYNNNSNNISDINNELNSDTSVFVNENIIKNKEYIN